jgi:hypothetical protein
MRACGVPPQAEPEISRFPCKELSHTPVSLTTPGRAGARNNASVHVAFRETEHVGTRDFQVYAAQWLAYALPCRRFADILADANARLGADADRYSFIVVDFHHLLLAGFYRRTGLLATPHALALDADGADSLQGRRERHRDQILSRGRWQFGLRDEIVHSWKGGVA